MKNKLILVTGGARSGKSRFAEKLAREAGEKRFYIATAPVFDAEMAERVARHKALRAQDNWRTIEEETDLASALSQAAEQGAETILVDCLTLWINNLLYRDGKLSEEAFAGVCGKVLDRARELPAQVVMVISEVGLGLVPENALSRRFRDLSGRCAQLVAERADEVYFLIAGISQRIK